MTTPEFTSLLFEIEVVAHIAHLQTTSYAQHKALDGLYKDIVDHRDSFLESYQGKFGIVKGYKTISPKEGVDMVKYLQDCSKSIDTYQQTLKDGYLKQIVDDIQELINTTLYFLRFLK